MDGFASRAIPVLVGLFAFFTPFSIAGAHSSLGAAVFVLLLSPDGRRRSAELVRHPLALPLGAWCLVSVAAVVFAVHPDQSFSKLKKLLLISLLPLGTLPAVRRAVRPIVLALIASTAIVALWGLVAFFLAGGGLDARIRGISGFYMTVAGILMLVGLVTLSELVAALRDPNPRRLAFLIVAEVAILAALLGTYTRGSWIGFVAGAAWLFRKRRAALLSVVVAAVLAVVLGPSDLRERSVGLFLPDHPRNVERVVIWEHGLGLIAEKPLTGYGLVIPKEIMDHEVETPYGTARVHSHMHNVYLQIAVSMGVPALIVFGWLIFALFRMARRAERAVVWNLWEQGLVAALPACLIAMLANGFFEWNFGDSEILGLLYLLVGLTLGVEKGTET
ncbi:MAG TPA: O-antigen ligase family protein [bacterium]|nr:O-antigen ligase family protein [bacterium]